MSVLYDEAVADKEVIKSLLNELRRRKTIMSKYLTDGDGNVYRVEQFELVSNEDLREELAEVTNTVKELEALLADEATPAEEVPVSEPVEQPAPEQPQEATPVAETPAPETETAQPEEAAPTAEQTPISIQ